MADEPWIPYDESRAMVQHLLGGGFMQHLVGDGTVAYVFEQDDIDVLLYEPCCSYSWKKDTLPAYLEKQYKNRFPFIRSASWKVGNVPQTVLDHVPLEAIKEALEEINQFSAENSGQYWAYRTVQKIKNVSDRLFKKYEVTLVPNFQIVPALESYTVDERTAILVLRWGNYYATYDRALEFAPKPQTMTNSLQTTMQTLQNVLLPEAEVVERGKEET